MVSRRLPPPPTAEDLHSPDCSIANTGVLTPLYVKTLLQAAWMIS